MATWPSGYGFLAHNAADDEAGRHSCSRPPGAGQLRFSSGAARISDQNTLYLEERV